MKSEFNLNLSLFNNSKYLISFDIARCTALFLILFMHVEAGFNSYTMNQFDNFLSIGPYGVPIFFLISGFLIFKSLDDESNRNFFNFWYKRFFRLLPLYYFLLVIYIILIFIFSANLNNVQEISLSKITSSLFFGFGRLNKTYLSASWALWPEFVFYSFTALFLINAPNGKYKRILGGLALISGSFFFSGAGFLGTYGVGDIEAIKPWTEDASAIGILLTCFGNLTCVLGTSFFLQGCLDFISLFKKNKFLFKTENVAILVTFALSSYFYSKGSYYFYFSSGGFLFLCLKTRNFLFLFIHLLILGFISLISYKNDINSLMIYLTFLIFPYVEKLTQNFNPILKKIIKIFSKISYSIYLVQIFTIPIYFKISIFLWKDNLFYWESLINCILFTIVVSYIVWYFLEKPLNKILFSKKIILR